MAKHHEPAAVVVTPQDARAAVDDVAVLCAAPAWLLAAPVRTSTVIESE